MDNNMKTLIITGGRFDKEFAVSFLKDKKYNYIIAVDYGLAYAEELGLTPDMAVGDFDTEGTGKLAAYEAKGCIIRRFIPEKDDTDTEIAVREAVKLKNPIDIMCATGGRIDHLLANIHNMKIALDAGVFVRIIDKCNIIWLQDKNFTISKNQCMGKYISFVPFAGSVKGITLKGFKYPLEGYTLQPGASRCISNELEDEEGIVEFMEGCMIVINSWDET